MAISLTASKRILIDPTQHFTKSFNFSSQFSSLKKNHLFDGFLLKIFGLFLMLFSITMLTPLLFTFYYHDDSFHPFLISFAVTFLIGLILWWPFREKARELKTREGFLIVSLFWIAVCVFGAIPFMLSIHPHLFFTDAVFETVSGFTTTGSTVVVGVDDWPHAIRFYRQQLQFVGGMGIIVLAVAILPMLGIGGMQLYRAETPGPIKDSKLTPRTTQTAKALWYIYVGLTILCALAYWASGMTWFEALGESFATVSTGGFSMHDASFAYYNSAEIEIVGIIFMILGALNFGLHFIAIQNLSVRHYFEDAEFKAFLWLLLISSLLCFSILTAHHFYPHILRSIPQIAFNVVSMITTTGYLAVPLSDWTTFLPLFIFLMALIGGCGGSTSGGIKVMRILLLHKQTAREFNRLIHPNAVVALKFGGHVLPNHVLEAMWGFISVFIGLFIVLLLGLLASGLDLTTAIGALIGCIANAGQGLGIASNNFASLNTSSKWILIMAMLAGRLEIFSLLVLVTPGFWRK